MTEQGRTVRPGTPVLPGRTCVGCRVRAAKPDLLRVTVVDREGVPALAPDPRGRLPGRGASLHPTLACLDLAERRRAFVRALRLDAVPDSTPVRRWIEEQGTPPRTTMPDRAERPGGPEARTSRKQVEKR